MNNLVESKRVSEIPLSSRGFWGHIFVVAQPNKWRLILDLSQLNKYLHLPSFQMVTMPEILKMINPGDWMTSVDIEKAYWQIPIHPQFRKFFQFRVGNRGFQFQVMPFGLSTAPYWFTRVIKPIITFLGNQGVKVTSYIDDFFITGSSSSIVKDTASVLSALISAGFPISPKSQLNPSQTLVFLGIEICSNTMSTSVPQKAREGINRRALMLSQQLVITRRQLESLTGYLNYYIVHTFFLRSIFFKIIALMNNTTSCSSRDLPVQMPQDLKDLLTEVARFGEFRPVSFRLPFSWTHIMLDASDDGWGACWGRQHLWGDWTTEQRRLSINARESVAVLRMLESWGPLLSGKSIQIHSDSVTAVAVIRRGGSPTSVLLSEVAAQVERLCVQWSIRLRAIHVPGVCNVVADGLSRRKPRPSEWSLSHEMFRRIVARWGHPEVDLFATLENAKAQTFVSLLPTSDLRDALSLSWDRWTRLYAFPPTRCIRDLLPRIHAMKLGQSLILVFPMWPARPWFSSLKILWESQNQVPTALRPGRQDLWQLVRNERVFHPRPDFLKLHAVLLSGTR